MNKNFKIYEDEILQLKGITNKMPIPTSSYVYLSIPNSSNTESDKFNIVSDDYEILQDGILDLKFLKSTNFIIYYKTQSIILSQVQYPLFQTYDPTSTNITVEPPNPVEFESEVTIPTRS